MFVKKIMKKVTYVILGAILLAPLALSPLRASADSANLILNPSVETETNSQPSNWTPNSWGSNTPTFSYDTTGHTGNRALSVSLKNYVSGDAKWMPNQAAVTAGQTYTYTDYSKSDVATELDVAYINTSGAISFAYLRSVQASSTWQQTTSTFTVPAGIVSASVYHILYSNGSLQTDDFSLTTPGQATPTDPTTPTNPTNPTTPTTPPAPAPTTTNLITNGSFETANGSDPSVWHRGGWGTNNATFTYLSGDAHTGTRSANLNISSLTSGDAKWYANPVSVSSGTTYTYQDYYKSNVATRVVVAMTNTSGVDSYTELAAAPSSATWTLYSANFTVPTGIKAVTIYHILDKVGTLTIDDVSLTAGTVTTNPDPGTGANSIANPSFETASGTKPANWQSEKWGTNTTIFTYVQNDGHTGTSSAKVAINNYTSGDAKWAFTPLTNLVPGSQYSFSAWYKTNTQAHVVADYVDANGVDQYLTLPTPLAKADAQTTWQQYNAILNMPANARSMTVYFLISSNGWLQTDDFSLTPHTPVGFNAPLISLTFDDGWSSIYTNGLPILQKYGFVSTQYLVSGLLNTPDYMTTAMAKAFQTAGSEIGSHTVTHPDLTGLTSAQLTAELSNSQTALRQLFGANVAQSFASPYGLYNSTTLAQIQKYYQSHRSTDVGFNTKDNFNPYNILVQDVNTDTTPTEVAAWVAKAKTDKSWLVLVYHSVINSTNPDDYAVSPSNLDQELANIKASNIDVKTISQALAILRSQL